MSGGDGASSYADRARHYRSQAAALRARGDVVGARRLDRLVVRATRAHARHTPVTLDAIVDFAAAVEDRWGRALTLMESSALKAAYQAATARGAGIAAVRAELVTRGWSADAVPIDEITDRAGQAVA